MPKEDATRIDTCISVTGRARAPSALGRGILDCSVYCTYVRRKAEGGLGLLVPRLRFGWSQEKCARFEFWAPARRLGLGTPVDESGGGSPEMKVREVPSMMP